jgi:hypothetical protein
MSKTTDTLLKTLIPQALRRRVWLYILGVQQQRRRAMSAAIPCVELTSRHLRNAVLLPSRADLLRALPKGGIVAEVGVDQGDFSQQILSIVQPDKLHLVDAWSSDRYHAGKGQSVEDRFGAQIADGTVEIHRGLSTDILPTFDDASFDWIYIDTGHGYALTAEELQLAFPKVKDTGSLAGHDYITANYEKDQRYGVVEAVHEFCVERDWELNYLTSETHQHRSFAISRIRD